MLVLPAAGNGTRTPALTLATFALVDDHCVCAVTSFVVPSDSVASAESCTVLPTSPLQTPSTQPAPATDSAETVGDVGVGVVGGDGGFDDSHPAHARIRTATSLRIASLLYDSANRTAP